MNTAQALQPAASPANPPGLTGSHPDCQVLIVGAGPTGLVLAADLLARGIRTRIVDKGDGMALESRAIGIHARTLEVLDMMGLADRFTERGQVVRHFRFYSQARCLASLDFARCGSRFGFLLDLPQDETQRLLRSRVAELGGVIEQRAELIRLASGSDAVTATIREPRGHTETITAGYVVGCDGAHSQVRHELGLGFDGHPYPQDWLLADVRLDRDLAEDAAHAFFRPDGLPVIFFPMRGHRWRLTLPFAGTRGEGSPTLEEIQRLTGQRAPWPVIVSDPTWLANFRCHRRSASAYRRGRVLLAGDAVHIHTPAGGQGMNTGVMDAHNLGWKLALVSAGRAPDTLLDSYGTERRPVAEEVLKLTHTLVSYGTMSHPFKRRIRDIVVPALARSTAIQERAVRRLTHVGVAYPAGPLTRPDSRRRGLRPGQRVPDMTVRQGSRVTTLHNVLRYGRHVLVVPAASLAGVLSDARLRPYQNDIDIVTGNTMAVSGTTSGGRALVVLVRPDGHMAVRARPATTDPVLDYLRDLFGDPVKGSNPPAPCCARCQPRHSRRPPRRSSGLSSGLAPYRAVHE
jgi:2-polyprenyl-6-methoxyphenol hydroxylase-like FAD-dependent oxidoreductase